MSFWRNGIIFFLWLLFVTVLSGQVLLNPVSGGGLPTPLFYHSFNNDGGTGSTATADQGDDCTLVNHAWSSDGAGGDALDFNGLSTQSTCGSGLDGLGTFTITAWINADTYGESSIGIILAKTNTSSSTSWFFRLNDFSGTNDFFQAAFCNSSGGIGGGNFSNCDAFNAPVDSMDACVGTATWCHVAVVFTDCDDLSTCDAQLYLDGSPVTTTRGNNVTGSPHSDGAYSVDMGHSVSGLDVFEGDLDEIKVFSSALSDAQISSIHSTGR